MYVDLWADRSADPGRVIVSAVRSELARHEGVLTRLAKRSGVDRLSVGGVAFSLDNVGLGLEVSLSDALAALSDEVRRPIVLIVDEAQHAITTDRGYDALFALKAARDELNSSEHHGLRVVATGSNRDKLAMLRNSRDQAFFGAPLVQFPGLGKDFVRWFCDGVSLAAPLDPSAVETLFVRASFRPEVLGAAADVLHFDFSLQAQDVEAKFAQAVEEQLQAADAQMLRVLHALTPLQSSVLRVLAARGQGFAPFEAATIMAYQAVLDVIAPESARRPGSGSGSVRSGSPIRAEVGNVQQALGALQEKALVWRERRGVYALEESSVAELLAEHRMLEMVPDLPSQADVMPPAPRPPRQR